MKPQIDMGIPSLMRNSGEKKVPMFMRALWTSESLSASSTFPAARASANTCLMHAASKASAKWAGTVYLHQGLVLEKQTVAQAHALADYW